MTTVVSPLPRLRPLSRPYTFSRQQCGITSDDRLDFDEDVDQFTKLDLKTSPVFRRLPEPTREDTAREIIDATWGRPAYAVLNRCYDSVEPDGFGEFLPAWTAKPLPKRLSVKLRRLTPMQRVVFCFYLHRFDIANGRAGAEKVRGITSPIAGIPRARVLFRDEYWWAEPLRVTAARIGVAYATFRLARRQLIELGLLVGETPERGELRKTRRKHRIVGAAYFEPVKSDTLTRLDHRNVAAFYVTAAADTAAAGEWRLNRLSGNDLDAAACTVRNGAEKSEFIAAVVGRPHLESADSVAMRAEEHWQRAQARRDSVGAPRFWVFSKARYAALHGADGWGGGEPVRGTYIPWCVSLAVGGDAAAALVLGQLVSYIVNQGLRPKARLIRADVDDPRLWVWLSRTKLAEQTGLTVKAAAAARDRLITAGLVEAVVGTTQGYRGQKQTYLTICRERLESAIYAAYERRPEIRMPDLPGEYEPV